MAVSAHLQELKNKHQNLDARIQTEQKAPAPNAMQLASLKKRKLHIKEKISALQA
jgi:hypothetical protein